MRHGAIIAALAALCVPPTGADTAGELTQAKEMFLRTPIATGGRPRAIIAAPAGEAYAPAVNKLQKALQAKGGATLPLRKADAVTQDDLTQYHIIALGSVPDNPFIKRLYGEQHLRDTWRPGSAGVAVRSVHNPYNTGRNVLFIGAGGPQTMPLAVDVFLNHLEHTNGALALPGFLMAFEPDREIPVMSDGAMKNYEKRADEYISFNNGRGMISTAASLANSYYSTGCEGYAEAFKMVCRKHEQLKGPGDGTHMNLWNAIVAWDRIEESPVFSDADRVRIANLLLYVLRSKEGVDYGFFKSGVSYGGVRHNHQTLPGLDAFFGGRYFKTWGLSEEGDRYIEMARKLFVTQSQFHKPMCDCNQYEWTTLYQTADWAAATGDMTIFDTGMYRTAADRAMIQVDNLGWGACNGDCWTAWSFPLRTLRDAAAQYRDGRYEWMIRKHYGDQDRGVSDLARGVEPVEPEDILGIAVAPMDEGFYRLHETQNEPEPNLPLEQCFDKLSLRQSFDAEDEYMLIDGIGMGSHGHQDTNCISRMTDNDRIWLVDMSYAEGPSMRDHNAVTVIRDGLGSRVPPMARLDAAADLDTFGLTQTSVPDYNGLDWRRHIFWRKGHYFLVVDEFEALQDGEYSTRCYWRSLGEPTIEGQGLTVTQQSKGADGPVAVVDMPQAANGKVAKFQHKSGGLTWKVSIPEGNCSLRVTARGYTTGDDSFFVHLDGTQVGKLYLSREKLAPAVFPLSIDKAGEHEIMLTLRESPGCVVDKLELVAADGSVLAQVEAEDCRFAKGSPPRRDTMRIQWAGVSKTTLVRDRDNFGKWWATYEHAEPVVNILQQSTRGPMKAGQVRTIANLIYVSGPQAPKHYELSPYEGAWTVADAEGDNTMFALRSGTKLAGINTDAEALVLSGDRIIAQNATTCDPPGATARFPRPTSLEWEGIRGHMTLLEGSEPGRQEHLPEAIRQDRAERSIPIPGGLGKCRDEALAALVDFEPVAPAPMAAATAALQTRWSTRLPAAVLSIAAGDLQGDGHNYVIAGCADGTVRLLDGKGTEQWQFRAGGKINSVCLGDVDADGKPEVLAGSDDRKCYCLNRDGSERWSYEGAAGDNPYWRRYWKAGQVEKVIAADIDGDGKDEVIFGAANMNLHAIDDDGKLMWKFTKYGVITSLLAQDMTGDGVPEVVGGPSRITCTSEVSVLDKDGKRLGNSGNDGWASALTALATANLDAPGRVAVICGTNFNNIYALDNEAGALSRRWKFIVGDVVTALCGVRFEQGPHERVVAGSAAEYAYCLDAQGELVWSTPLPGPVLKILPWAAPPLAGDLAAILTDEGIYLLDGAGKVAARHASLTGATDLQIAGDIYAASAEGVVVCLSGF